MSSNHAAKIRELSYEWERSIFSLQAELNAERKRVARLVRVVEAGWTSDDYPEEYANADLQCRLYGDYGDLPDDDGERA